MQDYPYGCSNLTQEAAQVALSELVSAPAVIATNWSGPTAFLDEGVGYPLAIDGLESVEDKGAFEGHMWAAPSVKHLKQLMGQVVQSPREAQKKGRSVLHHSCLVTCQHERQHQHVNVPSTIYIIALWLGSRHMVIALGAVAVTTKTNKIGMPDALILLNFVPVRAGVCSTL